MHFAAAAMQVGGMPLQRALSESSLNYLKYGLEALAGRYFLLLEHGVSVPRHADGGILLWYAREPKKLEQNVLVAAGAAPSPHR